MPVSTNNGNNLLLGNSDHVTAGGGRVGDISAYENEAAAARHERGRAGRVLPAVGVDWITDHPGRAAEFYAARWPTPSRSATSSPRPAQSDPLKDLVSALSYYPILALAVVRLLLYRRFPLHGLEKLSAMLIVVNVALLAVFFTRLRLRVPLDGLTILLAAAGIGCLVRLWRARAEAP